METEYKHAIKRNETHLRILNVVYVPLVIVTTAATIFLLSGCSGSLSAPWRGTIPELGGGVPPGSGPLAVLNWVLPLSVLGIAGSIFALVLPGISKSFGFAGLVASVSAAVFTLVLVKYAWLIAIGGVVVGLGTVVMAMLRNRGTIHGLIDGFQDVKDKIISPLTLDDARNGAARVDANDIMKDALPPHAQKIVSKRKNGNGKGKS